MLHSDVISFNFEKIYSESTFLRWLYHDLLDALYIYILCIYFLSESSQYITCISFHVFHFPCLISRRYIQSSQWRCHIGSRRYFNSKLPAADISIKSLKGSSVHGNKRKKDASSSSQISRDRYLPTPTRLRHHTPTHDTEILEKQ